MIYKGSCHCGKVSFQVESKDDFKEGLVCNCSICHRKGTVLTFVPDSQFKMFSGEKDLTHYQFGKKSIDHTFCSSCGVTAFASGKDKGGNTMRAINLRCLENLDFSTLKMNSFDGKSL